MINNNEEIENKGDREAEPAIYMVNGEEIRRMREEMQRLQARVQELEGNHALPLAPEPPPERVPAPIPQPEIPAPINNRQPDPPVQRHQEAEPGFMRRAMFFMYNVGNTHGILRNFAWALHDGAYVIGGVGAMAAAAVKVVPEVAMKAAAGAKKAMLAVGAAAYAHPIIAGVAAVAIGGAVIEKATRYEDEEGKTRHHCAVM